LAAEINVDIAGPPEEKSEAGPGDGRNLSLPPLNPLRAFDAAAQHLSFTRAAEALNVTQSAVSHQIRLLEDFLGQPLFCRTAHGLSLTESGKSLSPVVRAAFDSISMAVDEMKSDELGQPLTLSLRPFFSFNWLSPRLVDFRNTHPDIRIKLNHTNALIDFKQLPTDLAIVMGNGNWPNMDMVDVEFLMPCPLTPICNPSLIVGLGRPLKVSDLENYTLLHEGTYGNWPRWLQLAGVPSDMHHDVFIDDTNVRIQAAINGQGFTLGNPKLLADEIKKGNLVIPFELMLNDLSYYIVGSKAGTLNKKTKAFKTWVLKHAAG
jgi:LysR family glycine cleavage system transcriptional activator